MKKGFLTKVFMVGGVITIALNANAQIDLSGKFNKVQDKETPVLLASAKDANSAEVLVVPATNLTPDPNAKVPLANLHKEGAEYAEGAALGKSAEGLVVVYNGKDRALMVEVHKGLTKAAKEGHNIVAMIIAPGEETYSFYLNGTRIDEIGKIDAVENKGNNAAMAHKVGSKIKTKLAANGVDSEAKTTLAFN